MEIEWPRSILRVRSFAHQSGRTTTRVVIIPLVLLSMNGLALPSSTTQHPSSPSQSWEPFSTLLLNLSTLICPSRPPNYGNSHLSFPLDPKQAFEKANPSTMSL